MRVAAPVSVVISTYDEGDAVERTVESVLAASVVPRDIVLVDDGSCDGSCDRSWPPPVRVARRTHAGIAAARNHGATLATQDALVFLDAHCAVDDDWLEPLRCALAKWPDALVGPAVRDARDPRFVGVGARLVNPLFDYCWVAGRGRDEFEVGVVPGGCLAVRREACAAVGGFGAFDGFGLEDVELALRWWRSGRKLLGAPASVVTHLFRSDPPYPPDELAWLRNVLRTGLAHLDGAALARCVTACAPFPTFAPAIASVLAEPWVDRHRELRAREVRRMSEYFDVWAPRAFAD